MRALVATALRSFNLKVSKFDRYQNHLKKSAERDHLVQKITLSAALPNNDSLLSKLLQSTSQLGQDLFVWTESGCKNTGFFVEFGATNGIDLSNTYLLEQLGWTGILAEPARIWHTALKSNRRCAIETNCVWSDSNSALTFVERADAEFSTLAEFDSAGSGQTAHASYKVETISLLDLLKKHHAPTKIDYISLDTEGSELQILQAFNFDEYDIGMISCEHNYTQDRAGIRELLEAHGFERQYEEYSQFDDWYVNRHRS
jgi:FkbM family methyltransferase